MKGGEEEYEENRRVKKGPSLKLVSEKVFTDGKFIDLIHFFHISINFIDNFIRESLTFHKIDQIHI